MDFIFMLTRDDRTIEDGLAVLDEAAAVGVRHIGFKDVGATPSVLRELARRIRALGATSYMEVVSTTPEAARRSAEVAAEIGVDRLLGGTDADAMLTIVRGTPIEYFPFPGFPEGHPTRLCGTPADIAAHCQAFLAKGCHGVDLLAYRATAAGEALWNVSRSPKEWSWRYETFLGMTFSVASEWVSPHRQTSPHVSIFSVQSTVRESTSGGLP